MRIGLSGVALISLVGAAAVAPRVAEAACLGGAPDGNVAPTEDCDDNNGINGDGCSSQCTIEGEFSCARAVSFANLSIQSFPGSTAAWTVAPDNLSGVQTVNTPTPTIAVFGEDAMRGTYAVQLDVLTDEDDDWIGLALGFSPGDQGNASASYLVVDWKQLAQAGTPSQTLPGLRLAHVRGLPAAGTHTSHGIPQRLCPSATSCVTQLANGRRFGTTGWADQTPYTAYVTYRPDVLEIRVDGELELLVRPTDFPGQFPGNVFPPGQIGFYLLSQEQVEYTNLAPFGPSACNETALSSTALTRPAGTASVSVDVATLLVDASDALAPASVEVLGVTGAATATVSPTGVVTVTPASPNLEGVYTVRVYACDDDPVIPDCDTATITVVYVRDRDGDGRVGIDDLDEDDDGIPDRLESTLGVDPDADADGDGVPNYRDRNNRGDGQPGTCPDPDADGVCNTLGIEYDRDGDGVANHLDLDADGDGILDVIEVFPNLPDAARDGRLDCPGGRGTNGLCDAIEVVPDGGVIDWSLDDVGPDVASNRDLDGLPDFLDVDSDGDGVYDLDEGNSGCADTAPANGRCDGPDSDGDGVVNARDTVTGHGVGTYPTRPDTDGDGQPDFRDVDADGDGLPDLIEANSGCADAAAPAGVCDGADANGDGRADDAAATRPDTDGDGRPDYRDVDADGDGIRDGVEGTGDRDGDGRPDFRDLDSDNDGIPDVVEGQSGCADAAPRDARCDGPDANGDGVADTATSQVPPDTDGDGAVDFRDLDADNDGIPDRIEGGSGCADAAPVDAVCDGPDANGDGRPDGAVLVPTPDTDGDGRPDYRDLDADDDGAPDLGEGGSGCEDADGNAVCDGPDSDGDGIADSIDDAPGHGDSQPTAPTQSDGDGVPDYRDLDRDGDGAPDRAATGCPDVSPVNQRCDGPDTDGDGAVDSEDGFDGFGVKPDTDGDGVPDDKDLDSDNDGIPNAVEGTADTDGDGAPDVLDLDSDNDGLPDVVEAGHVGTDGNGDGRIDCPGGVGANGLCDAVETAPDSGVGAVPPRDTDGDGRPDFRDLDSDGDGAPDTSENGTRCQDAQLPRAVCDGGDRDGDGVVDSADGSDGPGAGGYPAPPDTDGDGTPDYRDLDSDGDGIYDVDEVGQGPAHDANNDGRVDGGDADGDGLTDPVDNAGGFGGGIVPPDTDGDGTPDLRDRDSDGDGAADVDEAGPTPVDPVDTDGDGAPDFQDPDSDGDGVIDGMDNCRVDSNGDQADGDADGAGRACDLDDNGDGLDDGLGLSGGGCAAGGTAGLAAAALWLAALVGARRRRRPARPGRARRGAGALGAAIAVSGAIGVAVAPRDAAAQASLSSAYSAERFQLTGHRDGILGVEWADVRGHRALDVGLWLGYANDPINLYRMSDGDRVASPLANRVGGDLVVALQLARRLELAIGAPLVVAQSQSVSGLGDVGGMPPSRGDLSGFGLGDLRLVPKLTLLRQGRSPVAIAVLAAVSLPTATSEDYGGDDGATIAPAIAISRGGSIGARLALGAGYRERPRATSLNLVVDSELYGNVGLGYRFASSLELDASFDVATAADDALGAFNRNFAEVRAGVQYDATRAVRVLGAAGLGVAEGFGTPDWRALLGVRVSPLQPREARRPQPPPPAVMDADRDGIADAADRCPAEPETVNGSADEDGCPEPVDPDGDGLAGDADRCPAEAEDVDAFQDDDGCPELDNDRDGVVDTEDACRDQPGVLAMKGCPDPDRDGDGVVDRLDNCPDEAGAAEHQGCTAKQLVKITDGKIELLDIVYFALDRAAIQARSFRLLDNVASVLGAHPEITRVRVEGHTDDQGDDAYNKRLSQRRAEAVVAYLARKGVARDRLEPMGFGEERPKAPNASKEGRATNRRVELVIVGGAPAGVEVRPTGPGAETREP